MRYSRLERLMAAITLTLSERTLEQAEQAAATLKRSVEEVLWILPKLNSVQIEGNVILWEAW